MKHFISAGSVEDVHQFVNESIALKHSGKSLRHIGEGKTLGLLFMNPSTRTRISTWKAAQMLGLETIFVNMNSDSWKLETETGAVMDKDRPEHIKDAAAVIGSYCDLIGLRSFPTLEDKTRDESEVLLNSFIRYSGKPVLSLESSLLHPLQSLADMMTIREHQPKGRKAKVVLSWAPHIKPIPHAVANSFAQWAGLCPDIDLHICHPEGYELNEAYTRGATLHDNQQEAFREADFIYFKNWSSYIPYGQMPLVKGDWLVNAGDFPVNNTPKFMHCLPVRRNVEVRDELLDSENSLVYKQAENRVYAALNVLKMLLENS